jgi:hypothetical protein
MRLGIWHRGVDRLRSASQKALQLKPLGVIAEEPFDGRDELFSTTMLNRDRAFINAEGY